MAQFDLNRAQDTPIPTLKLNEITPKNWHRFPPAIQPSNPIYVPTVAYNGGAIGDDVDEATANATDTYSPRNQAQKATLMGTTLAVDIGRARGAIDPRQPYPVAGDAPVAAPVISSLSPNTAPVTADTMVVTITGTGFTQWSTVKSGNYPIPSQFVDSTHLRIVQKPWASVPGTVTVVVTDHDVDSAPSNFVFT
jgi:hypothetical protein